MNLAIIGSKGAGKGTQIRELIDNFHLVYFSPTEMFRKAAKNKTAFGNIARDCMKRGELVPDDIVVGMVEEWLWTTTPTQNIVFDGFPRTLQQAQFLDQFFKDLERKLDATVYLDVSAETVAERLTGRRRCRVCNDEFHIDSAPFVECPYQKCMGEFLRPIEEDKPEAIHTLVNLYKRDIEPLLNFYRESDRLLTVDGNRENDVIHEEMVRVILPFR